MRMVAAVVAAAAVAIMLLVVVAAVVAAAAAAVAVEAVEETRAMSLCAGHMTAREGLTLAVWIKWCHNQVPISCWFQQLWRV